MLRSHHGQMTVERYAVMSGRSAPCAACCIHQTATASALQSRLPSVNLALVDFLLQLPVPSFQGLHFLFNPLPVTLIPLIVQVCMSFRCLVCVPQFFAITGHLADKLNGVLITCAGTWAAALSTCGRAKM